MESQFTKQQRHEIYIEALKQYNNAIKLNNNNGLCVNIMKATIKLYPEKILFNQFIICFPEITKHKPSNKSYDQHWWLLNYEGVLKRTLVLTEAIKLTR